MEGDEEMTDLRPDKNIQRVMISTPAYFVGEFVSEKTLITHAFPQAKDIVEWQARADVKNNHKRTYYIASFNREPDKDKNIKTSVPDYSWLGEYVSVFLSVLYGKRFDNHGVIEQNGRFGLPSIRDMRPCKFSEMYFNNSKPRKNLNIELNLDKVKMIEKMIDLDFEGGKAVDVFYAAAKSYLEALRAIEYDPENAFISLVMAGEILGDFYRGQFTEDELYDETIRKQFQRIENEINGGDKVVRVLKGRLFQVKRVFTRVILKLLSIKFFDGFEGDTAWMAVSVKGIRRNIMSTYDLRSHYIHTGARFGPFIEPMHLGSEVGGSWVMDDKKLKKLLNNSFTFLGMERVIRFCLLRFLALNGLIHHEDLTGPGLRDESEASAEAAR